ncbi:right-handed parallel beta-helix repeat-containing protein [Parascardovia denticolens]
MKHDNYYDVTEWPGTDPHQDIGKTMNEIIADIHHKQGAVPTDGNTLRGLPGATIHIPVGDWPLHTQVVIDISYVRVEGEGHGFTSSSIRYNADPSSWSLMHEIWPGGSRIINLLASSASLPDPSRAAILIHRDGEPRISSVEIKGLCIDGAHFLPTTNAGKGADDPNPENSYANGRAGIWIDSANDSFRISECGFVYLERGLVIRQADAISVHDNFIAECGNCLEMLDWSQASKITDNLIGAGYIGYSISIENGGGILVTGNNIFPRGKESILLNGCIRTTITANRLNSFYPGMIVIRGAENLIAANHLYRSSEPWVPMLMHKSSLEDPYGLIRVEGNDNTIVANHISIVLDPENISPAGSRPVGIRVSSGTGNKIMENHVVARTENSVNSDKESAFKAQVGAVLSISATRSIPFISVQIDEDACGNTVLDSGAKKQLHISAQNAYRADPSL